MSAPPASLAAPRVTGEPEVVVVDAPDDAPLAMPSVCMKCFDNVRVGVVERKGLCV